MEEGVDGKCENIYDVAELPEYMLEEVAPGLVDIKKCEGKKIYQILKSRNVDKCVEQSLFSVNQPGRFLCPMGNCESMWQRSSLTRYIACGPSVDELELQVIVNEGEIQESLLAYKTEERKDLLQNLPLTEKTVLPVIQLDEEILVKLSPATLKQKIVEKLTKVANDLKKVEEFEEKHVSLSVLSISKVFSLLSTEEIKSLYSEVKGLSLPKEVKETLEQLVLEVAVISGTNPSIMFVKEMIVSEKISPLRIGTIITSLPHYILTPTVKLLDEIFEIIKSPVVTRHEILKSNAELSFATLINRACIDSSRITRFPVFVYGEFCNTETSALVSKYIPYLLTNFTQLEVRLKKSQLLCHWEHLDMNLLSLFSFLILKAKAPLLNNEWLSML